MSTRAPGNTTVVPRIIHQTWKTSKIPEKWKAAQQSCINLNRDFEYRLWTDEDSLRFIEAEFPWFLPTYVSYPYAIQRVDAIRYFILYRHGGVYIDLDMGCSAALGPLLTAPFTAPLTHPVGISNDVMASEPRGVFMHAAIQALAPWNLWLVIKYVQVMFTTGPMFLTVLLARMGGAPGEVALISPPDYGKYAAGGSPMFYHLHGSSWHASDASLIFWMERYGKVVLLAVAAAAVAGGVLAWRRRAAASACGGRCARRPTLVEQRQHMSKYGAKQPAYSLV